MTPHADTQNIKDLLEEFDYSHPDYISELFGYVLRRLGEIKGTDAGTQVSDAEMLDVYPEYD